MARLQRRLPGMFLPKSTVIVSEGGGGGHQQTAAPWPLGGRERNWEEEEVPSLFLAQSSLDVRLKRRLPMALSKSTIISGGEGGD
jgi:hypothetical protein